MAEEAKEAAKALSPAGAPLLFRNQLHATDRAISRLVRHKFRVHGTGIKNVSGRSLGGGRVWPGRCRLVTATSRDYHQRTGGDQTDERDRPF